MSKELISFWSAVTRLHAGFLTIGIGIVWLRGTIGFLVTEKRGDTS